MDNVAQFALVSLTSLLFIVDPIAVVPAYLVITNDEAAEDQRRTAKRACIVMTMLIFFARRVICCSAHLQSRCRRLELPVD